CALSCDVIVGTLRATAVCFRRIFRAHGRLRSRSSWRHSCACSRGSTVEVIPMSMQSINPATGEVVETFEEATRQQLERMLADAQAASHEWRSLSFATRAQGLHKAASLLRAHAADLARTMALEMGKPVSQGEAEIEKCAWVCEYYAQHAEAFLAPQPRET